VTADTAHQLKPGTKFLAEGYNNGTSICRFRQALPATVISVDPEGITAVLVGEGWSTRHVPFDLAHQIAEKITSK